MYFSRFWRLLNLVIVFFFLCSSANGSYLETSDYSHVLTEIQTQVSIYGKDQVLVVFDIDNTLLANTIDLGTDQWFEWQHDLIKSGETSLAVARDLAGLIKFQNLIYALGSMRETQEIASDVVEYLQLTGISTIALTARNIESRDATTRELYRNGFDFGKSSQGNNVGFPGKYLPYSLSDPDQSGLSSDELEAWGLKAARPVSYMDGVYMVGGQHKGAMLRALLKKTLQEFQAIVFVDDKLKNIAHMQAAFETNPRIALKLIRYNREDANVARFAHGSKAEVVQQMELFTDTLGKIFGTRTN